MKRLAGLTALALVIGNTSGCGWLWGPEGYFRDRATTTSAPARRLPCNCPKGCTASRSIRCCRFR